jgi:hypothetical protein
MDIKDIKNLREIMGQQKEVRKSLLKEIVIEEEEIHISTEDLLRGYSANRKICEEFFPREKRIVHKIAVFDFGEISSKEAEEKMKIIGFVPANVYEALIALGKDREIKGDLFISGSPSDPEDLSFSTFPMIKVNGGKVITLNVDLKVEKRFFVGVELIKEEKEKEVV